MMRKPTKAIIAAAGFGTRFLPQTKAMPKEMLPIVDKPVIQYVVDEALEAGVEHLVFVTGRSKAVIEDYFDIQVELEQTLIDGETAEGPAVTATVNAYSPPNRPTRSTARSIA